jgi:LacI family transcriptional regulator
MLAAAGDGATCTVYPGEFSVEHGRRATTELLASAPRPTAIIAGGNMLMQGALLALRDARIQVGQDISFVGCDDVVIAEVHQPPIAVVRRDIHAIGVAAADVLLAEFEPGAGAAEDGPREVVLPTEFVARASCAPVP